MDKKNHWEGVYNTKASDDVSWFQVHATQSLAMIDKLKLEKTAAIIDIGGGASTLVDDLLIRGFENLQVLDLSAAALAVSQSRLAEKAQKVDWLVGDITELELPKDSLDLWHDRAVFHFLTEAADQQKYISTLKHSLKKGGHVIIATFAEDGPQKCSGLAIQRHSAESLQRIFGDNFELLEQFSEQHQTPFTTSQNFIYCLFSKR
ncbi:MAG: class I SAM-dependent methyltransferase [Pseudomonadales bacterium]|nr:class I SAM-dependent methyltransferase [Pseudomonadales bacterium]